MNRLQFASALCMLALGILGFVYGLLDYYVYAPTIGDRYNMFWIFVMGGFQLFFALSFWIDAYADNERESLLHSHEKRLEELERRVGAGVKNLCSLLFPLPFFKGLDSLVHR